MTIARSSKLVNSIEKGDVFPSSYDGDANAGRSILNTILPFNCCEIYFNSNSGVMYKQKIIDFY